MMHFSCLPNFEHNSRLAHFASPEKMKGPEAQKEIPKAEEITKEHIDRVINAVDKNISSIEDYYKDYFTSEMRGEKMPKEVKEQIRNLRILRTKLDALRNRPKFARDTLVKIYAIFEDLDTHAKTTRQNTEGDPLAGFGIDQMRAPDLNPEKKPEKKAEKPMKTASTQEALEVSQEKLVLAAVENIARANGTLTQAMLDALKKYKSAKKVLRFDFKIQGNPVTIFVERGKDGFAARGGIRNEEKLAKGEAPTWKGATFSYSHKFEAKDDATPGVQSQPMETYVGMIASGELAVPEELESKSA